MVRLTDTNLYSLQRGLVAVARLVSLCEIQRAVDDKTDKKSKNLTWTKLLSWVHEATVGCLDKFNMDDPTSKAKGSWLWGGLWVVIFCKAYCHYHRNVK